eukprot:6603437-Pyramimonas_sp.AAC.1
MTEPTATPIPTPTATPAPTTEPTATPDPASTATPAPSTATPNPTPTRSVCVSQGLVCGDDGCGDSCGQCSSPEYCAGSVAGVVGCSCQPCTRCL